MKKYISLFLALLLASAVFAFAACKDDGDTTLSPEELASAGEVAIDFSGLTNFKRSVDALPTTTNINNNKNATGAIDKLLTEGRAINTKLEEETPDDPQGLESFREAFEKLETLTPKAEAAAAAYVRGFYTAVGDKTVKAVYCYMQVSFADVNKYLFALTYDDNGADTTVYTGGAIAADTGTAETYAAAADKYYASSATDRTNAMLYSNLTLSLDKVLSLAAE